MSLKISILNDAQHSVWDTYVYSHPAANLYHLSGWKKVIEETYGHDTYYILAIEEDKVSQSTEQSVNRIVGVLPLVHMSHFIFGKKLVSIPFFDMGGILADNEVISSALLKEAVTLGRSLKVDTIELREREKKESGVRSQESEEEQDSRVQGFEGSRENTPHVTTNLTNSTNKVRMILALPGSSEELMASFKSKLRSQIKRPIKDGLTATIGGLELLDPFYSVFCVNMRDLGSPVHSRKLIETVLSVFSETAKIVMVYKNNTPIAGSIIIGFKDILENPWASSLKAYSHLSPNMLLYWTMLEYACDKGFRFFDFGRSTPGEGTFQFKKQWGSESSPLHWHTIYLNGQQEENDSFTEKNKFSRAIKYWQKLPVPLTRALGPIVRKNISL